MKVINPLVIDKIISNHNYSEKLAFLDDVQMSVSSRFDDVDEKAIPVDFSVFREMHAVKVKPNSSIESHSHDSPVFRYVTEGSMELNGVEYKKDDWVVVPKNTEYSIQSGPGGYDSIIICIFWQWS